MKIAFAIPKNWETISACPADYCFILDPWWNPAAEAQAIARAHRMGQTKKVFAYRLIARDTVEEKILALQAKKKTLASAIIRLDEAFAHVAKQVRDKTWKPGIVRENLATGTCIAVLNPQLLKGPIDASLQAKVAAAGAALIAGTLTIPDERSAPADPAAK